MQRDWHREDTDNENLYRYQEQLLVKVYKEPEIREYSDGKVGLTFAYL